MKSKAIHRLCYFAGRNNKDRKKLFADFRDARPYAEERRLKVFYDKMYSAPIQVWPGN